MVHGRHVAMLALVSRVDQFLIFVSGGCLSIVRCQIMCSLPAWRTNYGPLKDPCDTRNAHQLPSPLPVPATTLATGKLLSFFSPHAGNVRKDTLIAAFFNFELPSMTSSQCSVGAQAGLQVG
jgi:hypothetical protein